MVAPSSWTTRAASPESAIEASPQRQFILPELVAIVYPGETLSRSHLIAVRRALYTLRDTCRLSYGRTKYHNGRELPRAWLTVRAFDPQ